MHHSFVVSGMSIPQRKWGVIEPVVEYPSEYPGPYENLLCGAGIPGMKKKPCGR
jgi:hypothetical protein